MTDTCDICGEPATNVGFYGNDDTCMGGGLAQAWVCESCTLPCTHWADPHASLVWECSVAEYDAIADASAWAVPHMEDLPL